MDTPQRRASDHPDVVIRVTRMEDNLSDLHRSLKDHIEQEGEVLHKIADTQMEMGRAIVRLTTLEEQREKRDTRVSQMQEKVEARLDRVESRADTIWILGTVGASVAAALWAVGVHFHWF